MFFNIKKYSVDNCRFIRTTVEVLADSEEEAKLKASMVLFDENDIQTSYLDRQSIVEEIEIGSLWEMIQQATKIIKDYYEGQPDGPYKVIKYPYITLPNCWDGYGYSQKKALVEDFYYDPYESELAIVFEMYSDSLISECNDIDQYKIAKCIIESKSLN